MNKVAIAGSSFIFLFIFLWAVKFFNISYPISVTNHTTSGELSVVGEGKIDAVPDTANVQASIVVADGKTVEDTQKKVTEINNKIIEALQKIGIEKKDIKTSNYSVNPNYSYSPNGTNSIGGYNGNASLTITVRKQELLPKVLTEATAAGANQVNNSGFTIENPEKYREQARQKAIDNAKEQARKLAGQLGIRLGKITNIVESSPGVAMPYAYSRGELLDAQVKAPQIEPGSQTVTSTVTLFFEKN